VGLIKYTQVGPDTHVKKKTITYKANLIKQKEIIEIPN
jgi:hypothetical protein